METFETGRSRLTTFVQPHTASVCDARMYIEASKQVPLCGALPKRCFFYFLRTYASAPQCSNAAALAINVLTAECESKGEPVGATFSSASQTATGGGTLRSCALFALCASCAVCDSPEARQLCSRSLLDALHDPAVAIRQNTAIAVTYYDEMLRRITGFDSRPNKDTNADQNDASESYFHELFGHTGIVDRLYLLIRDTDINVAITAFESLAYLLAQPKAGRIVITHLMMRYLLEKRLNDISDWQLVSVLKILAASDAFSKLLKTVSSPESGKDRETVNFLKDALRGVILRRCTADLFDCVVDTRSRRAKLTLLRTACDMLVKLAEIDAELHEVFTLVHRVASCSLLYFNNNNSVTREDEDALLAAFLSWFACIFDVQFCKSCQLNVSSSFLSPRLGDSNALKVAKLQLITKLVVPPRQDRLKTAANQNQVGKVLENLKTFLTDRSIRHVIVAIVVRDWLPGGDGDGEGELIAGLPANTLSCSPIVSVFDGFLHDASLYAEDELEEAASGSECRLLSVFLEDFAALRRLPRVRGRLLALVALATENAAFLSNASERLLMALVRVLADHSGDFQGASYLFERVLRSRKVASECEASAVLRCAVALFTHEPAEMQPLLAETFETFAPVVPNRVRFYYALLRQVAASNAAEVTQQQKMSLLDLRRILLSDSA